MGKLRLKASRTFSAYSPLAQNSNDAQGGQAFIEFVFLMAVVVILSLGFTRIVDTKLSQQWKDIVNKVAAPASVTLR